MAVDFEVKGLIEAQRKCEQVVRDLVGTPILDAMRDSTLIVQAGAKKNLVAYESPEVGGVDSGRTRASYTPEIRLSGDVVAGVVGSNLKTALWQETGTRPHWPPIDALVIWARRHGTTAYLVARGIARHGTRARRPLGRAFEDARDKIVARFERAMKEIIDQ
ncbi:MAG: hypothetical protein EHM56_08000 [Chloroflexi bacterium]|nr:MAG: hypothetical protein EHM56_08000 [Chloroflexota bacterium]